MKETETPIEVTRIYVMALPTRPRTGIIRMCSRDHSQAYVLSTTLMHHVAKEIVRVGLQIEERAKRETR